MNSIQHENENKRRRGLGKEEESTSESPSTISKKTEKLIFFPIDEFYSMF
jgi:hypothetical protein